jgi:hypothetical protein
MPEVFDRKDLIYRMTHKGFEAEPTGSGHLGLFLLNEQNKRTGVRTGVPMGGHGQKLGIEYIKRMAHHLHINTKDFILFKECNHPYGWLLQDLREKGWIPKRV